ncbi:MAG: hypothetical protein VR64_11100 [Desulfatitalea sp. BRH_c12]|nr:MAG: hypothetical protein VR64_11100 [Desulfatitalea sp. BRH_c12]
MNTWALTPIEVEALRLSLWVSGWAVAASLPLGIAVAWILSRCDFTGCWCVPCGFRSTVWTAGWKRPRARWAPARCASSSV